MLQITSPYDLSLIKEIPLVGKVEVEKALSTAYALFQDQSKWIAPHERIAILKRAASIMQSRLEELTKTATQEGGKPLVDSKIEVLRAINGVELAAEHIGQLKGEQIPMGLTKASENRIAFTSREPIGVVSSISAFNHPLNLIVHQVVTAVAAGCPVIVKPALTTPLSCLTLVDILKEAGLPDGWCQAIICDNDAAELLVTDSRINYFSFIGSAKVGWYLKSKLANGTRCALEHGGAAPVIVEKDADFETLLPSLLKGGFYHAGQVCVSVQRVFVHESICDDVANKLAEMASKLVVGDQMDEKTEVGPLILPREVDRVEEWVNEAIQAGTKVLCGGKRISNTCFEPTVLLDPPLDAKVSRLEIFGPVVCVYSYADRDKAIEIANSLDVHFQAAVFTKDLDVALDCVKKLNATAVMVNDHTAFRVDWMPFGGRDTSGIGMGGIQYSMHEMTREKLMVIKSKVL
ncbi:aldehyde dehydrogenase family protein [Arcticibacterium luteifluviistationis]|uniref:Aldehyde dehydrogenase n=1 Tax=Arcticibacterium luteifluviistationis TaxID=1784714 RepID=A0A2Z4GBL0_9BACT|nr:aldehyde dehydrogenase family protein [Arcticibacterium luteifluviistationis]AWV98458.1 aldehyde dehydrogenase [Arcticibacterium luteifluviistationis]